MRGIDHKLINQIKHAHAKVADMVMAVMLRYGVPATDIQHIFYGADDDEYILAGKTGFHVTINWDGEGKVTCEAEPGEFVETSGAAPMWVKRITSFHRTIGDPGLTH